MNLCRAGLEVYLYAEDALIQLQHRLVGLHPLVSRHGRNDLAIGECDGSDRLQNQWLLSSTDQNLNEDMHKTRGDMY